ncbi:MAG: FtsX-like permease family protein [Candidatus Moranbacteria bacterium]|nr:FtsX-like permease family protein [Candidatus Moranbacteria bacterium]
MNLSAPVKISISNLLASKLRSFLTILGIIIGVAAVMIIFAVGRSAEDLIVSQLQGIGSNLIAVLPGESDQNGPPAIAFGIVVKTLTYEDLEALRKPQNVRGVEAAAGYYTGTEEVRYKDFSRSISATGVTANYIEVENAEIEKGRFFKEHEERDLSKIVTLGSEIANEIFGSKDPIGEKIKIGDQKMTIVGVLSPRSAGGFGSGGQDTGVFLPLKTAQKLVFAVDHLFAIRLKVKDHALIKEAKQDITQTLLDRHNLEPGEEDFSVRDLGSAIDLIKNVTTIIRYFLLVAGSISLLVGGVGIMNIMLIAVNQRIKEVGLRKALGAKNADIQAQFLIESATVALIGGLFGIIFGSIAIVLAFLVINALDYDWPFIISIGSILVSVLVSLLVGLLFGLYPAYKASRISPMEALRYE